ncbi:MAG TPA: FAD/NAD(P)-binding protein [Acidobacteriota bacterium]|nr:FAD/NAD(P)-binding protein [Acidobacteriota bacterium]
MMKTDAEYYHQLARETFLPQPGRIVETADMTAKDRYFRVELEKPLGHHPGQFVMVSVLGVGEAPISISCGPGEDNMLEMVIRRIGRLTQVIHDLKVGDTLGIRGPYGSGFDLNNFYGKDVLFVAGGLGLVPLRSLITPVVAQAEKFGAITLISGCRNPAEELFRDQLKEWTSAGIKVIRLVDGTENMPWEYGVGLVTEPIPKLQLDPDKTVAALCGPPVMYKFVITVLSVKKIRFDQIYVDLERRMKCGVGKCGHCQINKIYCCQDGPVFRFSDLALLPEAL